MNMLSEFLAAALTAIGTDIKAIFAKFDATGKLLKTNLPALTKSDVGLGNVDNTADANKTVASAAKLVTARRIDVSRSLRSVSGTLYFDGSSDISIGVALQPVSAFSDLYGGSNYVRTPDNDADPASYAGGTRYSCYYGKQDDPWRSWSNWGSYWLDTVRYGSSSYLQTALPDRTANSAFKGMFVRYFDKSGTANGKNTLKWVPISTNVYTYETTTTETPNVYVGTDGVLKRSTNPPKSTVILEGTIGTADNGYQTNIIHGLDVNSIKSVTAKINISTDANIPIYVQENSLSGIDAGIIGYTNYFTVGFNLSFVTLKAHRTASAIHGKPVTIFIETI